MNLSQRIWRGDSSAVREALQQYGEDGDVLKIASILYSFRYLREYQDELRKLLSSLNHEAWVILKETPEPQTEVERLALADRIETLTSILIYLGQRPATDAGLLALVNARALIPKGLRLHKRSGHHTRAFLLLHCVSMDLNKECRDETLREAIRTARRVVDPNQRARVYRKIGLYLGDRFPCRGLMWSIKACFVPGSTLAVRLKSLVALAGLRQ